jgi:hypothetical protein
MQTRHECEIAQNRQSMNAELLPKNFDPNMALLLSRATIGGS